MAASMLDVSRRLRDARRAKKISQTEGALALGISQTFLSSLERGLVPERLESLVRFARLVDLDPGDLLQDLTTVFGQLETVFKDYDLVIAALSAQKPQPSIATTAA